MKEQKTVKEWFETLPEGYRELALKEMENVDSLCNCMAVAISRGLRWNEAPEGFTFWRMVYDHYDYTEFSPDMPELPPLPK